MHTDFDKLLAEKWKHELTLGPALQFLASELTSWNKEVFGNLFRRRRKLWNRIEGIQARLADGATHLLKSEMSLQR